MANEEEDDGEDDGRGELDIDDLIAKSRARSGVDSNFASLNSSSGSLRSSDRGSKKSVDERVAPASAKMKAAVGAIISAKRLETAAVEANEIKSTSSPQDDPDLVVPNVVLELWQIVAEGAANHSGKSTRM